MCSSDLQRCYSACQQGLLSEDLWVDCVLASAIDPDLATSGRHVLTTFVQYVPYRLRGGATWDTQREVLGDRVVEIIGRYAPNVPDAVVARDVLTPLDLERRFGLTEGNIFHGELSLEQLAFLRPVPAWAKYKTPIENLWMGGSGVHPGGGLMGGPGYLAAASMLKERAV